MSADVAIANGCHGSGRPVQRYEVVMETSRVAGDAVSSRPAGGNTTGGGREGGGREGGGREGYIHNIHMPHAHVQSCMWPRPPFPSEAGDRVPETRPQVGGCQDVDGELDGGGLCDGDVQRAFQSGEK